MAVLWTCQEPTCAQTFETRTELCPKCGGPMRRVGDAPWRGWVLLVLGLFLIALMGTVTLNMLPALSQPGIDTADGSRFDGTAEQAQAILYLFYSIIGFGAVTALNGAVQLVTKRQHPALFVATLLAVAVLGYFLVTSLQALD